MNEQLSIMDGGVLKRSGRQHLTHLPISVLDVGAVKYRRKRIAEDHNSASSRSNFSDFPVEVMELCCELFLRESNQIFDPFAGWGERAAECAAYGKEYLGYDISPAAISSAIDIYGVSRGSVHLADTRSAFIPPFDGLVTCPPYWNLEMYSGDGLDACASWESFLSDYGKILTRCVASARSGAVFCIVTGDWRAKGVYYDLTSQTWQIMKWLGARMRDTVILSRAKTSKIKIMIPQAVEHGYTVKVHETLQVFEITK